MAVIGNRSVSRLSVGKSVWGHVIVCSEVAAADNGILGEGEEVLTHAEASQRLGFILGEGSDHVGPAHKTTIIDHDLAKRTVVNVRPNDRIVRASQLDVENADMSVSSVVRPAYCRAWHTVNRNKIEIDICLPEIPSTNGVLSIQGDNNEASYQFCVSTS